MYNYYIVYIKDISQFCSTVLSFDNTVETVDDVLNLIEVIKKKENIKEDIFLLSWQKLKEKI